MPKLQLTMRATQFIADEDQIDAQVPVRTLVVDRKVFDSAVSLASSQGFRPASQQLFCRFMSRAQTASFVRCVRRALATKVEAVGVRASSRMTPGSGLYTFFAAPANNRALQRLLSFVEQGGELTAEEL